MTFVLKESSKLNLFTQMSGKLKIFAAKKRQNKIDATYDNPILYSETQKQK